MTTVPDPELIAAHLAGDRRAFAAIYDRYAPALYDVARAMTRNPDDAGDLVHDTFVIAAQRLGQLRQPDRLRAWLFAILRHEVYRSSRRRSRERPTERVAEVAPAHVPDPGADLDAADLAQLVRDASGGLDERDRLVLELVARQRLEGADLADALGVTIAQTYSLVHRMRQRFTRAAGAAVVARTGRASCAELDRALDAWDGRYDVLTRKRVARHVDDCAACQRTREKAGLLELLAASPASALPAGLRAAVLADALGAAPAIALDADGFPERRRPKGRVLVGVGVVVAVLLVAGVAATVVRTSRPTLGAPTSAAGTGTSGGAAGTGTPAPTGAGGATATSVPPATTGGPGATAAPAGEPAGDTTTAPNGPGATVAPSGGADPPTVGTTAAVTTGPTTPPAAPGTTAGAAGSTATPPPGPTTATTPARPPTTGTTAAPPTRPPVIVPPPTTVAAPQIRIGDPSTTVLWTLTVCGPGVVTIAATVLRATTGVTVTLSWTGPGRGSGTAPMTAGTGGVWTAPLGPFTTAGTVTYTVSATNPGSARTTTAPRTVTVRACTP